MKPLSVAQINQLRVLLRKSAKPPSLTADEQRVRKNARRALFKANSLAHAQMTWDVDYARILSELSAITNGGPTLSPQFAIGDRPTVCTPHMQARYREHLHTTHHPA